MNFMPAAAERGLGSLYVFPPIFPSSMTRTSRLGSGRGEAGRSWSPSMTVHDAAVHDTGLSSMTRVCP